MLGRKSYTQEEFDAATTAIGDQLKAYRKLAKAVEATGDAKSRAALEAFEPLLFNGLALALDRRFVHRLRVVTGKDPNPLNEVELLTASLLDRGGIMTTDKVVRYKPSETVLELEPGDRIELSEEQFTRLSKGFFAELEARFLNGQAGR